MGVSESAWQALDVPAVATTRALPLSCEITLEWRLDCLSPGYARWSDHGGALMLRNGSCRGRKNTQRTSQRPPSKMDSGAGIGCGRRRTLINEAPDCKKAILLPRRVACATTRTRVEESPQTTCSQPTCSIAFEQELRPSQGLSFSSATCDSSLILARHDVQQMCSTSAAPAMDCQNFRRDASSDRTAIAVVGSALVFLFASGANVAPRTSGCLRCRWKMRRLANRVIRLLVILCNACAAAQRDADDAAVAPTLRRS